MLFIMHKFFTIKMDEGDDILDHINKLEYLANQRTCLEVIMKEEDVIMALLESLPPLFYHLITALETRLMKELTLDFITACLMDKVSKKEKEPQGDDAAMLSCQPRAFDNNERRANNPRCYNCAYASIMLTPMMVH